MDLEIINQSSLAKIFPLQQPGEPCLKNLVLWRGERAHFQCVMRSNVSWAKVTVTPRSALAEHIRLRSVEHVPVDYFPPEFDADSVGTAPGLYPDLLKDLTESCSTVLNQWKSIWVTITVPEDLPAGEYPLVLDFEADLEGEKSVFPSPEVTLQVQDRQLPPQTLKNTHWFHCDCLAAYYKTEIFSEKHWELIGNFMRAASYCGINMLLTPVITPPLDTEIGHYRPIVQLVDVFCDKGLWRFDFSKLERWCALARACGITHFECAHLFTQWGAKATPRIAACCDGEERVLFGWETPSDAPEYEAFLAEFLPALSRWIKDHGWAECFYFHCSDEPRQEDHLSYGKAFALLKKYLPDMKLFDAMSNPDNFAITGRQTIPVVCENHLELFEKEQLPERWTYYCCEPFSKYPNRFIYMQSKYNRILGTLLYLYRMEGFLHWGFNFYHSRGSRFKIDPYRNTTAGGAFPAGDAFIVYPGGEGLPEFSLRAEVFYDALQDLRCLQQLEKIHGREKVCQFIHSFAPSGTLSMKDFNVTPDFFAALRRF